MDRRKRERPEIELELALNSVTVIAFMRICREKSQVGEGHSGERIEKTYFSILRPNSDLRPEIHRVNKILSVYSLYNKL